MIKKLTVVAGLVTAVAVGSMALAGGHSSSPEEKAIKARKAQMQLYSFHLGILGAMAKGEMDYNADLASAAATSLAAVANSNQMAMWPPGTDSDTMAGKTRALPAIWQDGSKAVEISMQLAAASSTMAESAGNGVDGIRSAIGAVGKACGACHDDYRQPR